MQKLPYEAGEHVRPIDDRVVNSCDVCNKRDDHPRHIVSVLEANNMVRVQTRHMDCCANSGCPDGSCNTILEESGHAHGKALIAHLTKGMH